MDSEVHKKCFKCGETKHLSLFYKHSQMADGHVNKCKECNKHDVRENYSDKNEYYKEYDKQRNKDKESLRIVNRKKREKTARHCRKNVYGHDPVLSDEMVKKATTKVSNATRDGRLKRETSCFCCGSDKYVQAHHASYDEDMWLVVTWLCASCHQTLHKAFMYGFPPWQGHTP